VKVVAPASRLGIADFSKYWEGCGVARDRVAAISVAWVRQMAEQASAGVDREGGSLSFHINKRQLILPVLVGIWAIIHRAALPLAISELAA